MQKERIAAFGEYIEDVKRGQFPQTTNLTEMPDEALRAVIAEINYGDSVR